MVLVTGATGCLGSNLTRALVERGERVAVFRRESDSLDALGGIASEVEHRIGDVRDAATVDRAMTGIERIYHLAGIPVLTNRLRDEMRDVNVEGARNVARAALASRVARMVHTSSAAAVGWPDGAPADERFRFNGDRFGHGYMTTKWLGERAVLDAVGRGLDAVVVNPSAVLAPGGTVRHGWAGLVAAIMRGRLRLVPPGGLGVTTARDVVDGHIKAMERGTAGQRYIVNTRNLRYRDLFGLIADTVGARQPRIEVAAPMLRVAGWGGTAYGRLARPPDRSPVVVRENIPMLTRRLYYDQAKAVRELGISQSPLEEAVLDVRAWCDVRMGGDGR